MTPFEEYLLEAKQLREEYTLKIAQNPAQKQQLEEELKHILQIKLDECEAKEIARSKHL